MVAKKCLRDEENLEEKESKFMMLKKTEEKRHSQFFSNRFFPVCIK